jgi:uncharacterized protein YjhX (UPF0386 family)
MLSDYLIHVAATFKQVSRSVRFDEKTKCPLSSYFVERGMVGSSPLSIDWLQRQTVLATGKAIAQGKPVQRQSQTTPQPPSGGPQSHSGLPENLRNGIESLSGLDMSDVRVHYNSPRPAQLQAHAFAQGTEIHLAPGQEKHLAHEAWHVVQQKQGRVKPTMQMKSHHGNASRPVQRNAHAYAQGANIHLAPGQEKHLPHEAWHVVQQKQRGSSAAQFKSGVPVNDDTGLELEADRMGARAAQLGSQGTASGASAANSLGNVVQRYAPTARSVTASSKVLQLHALARSKDNSKLQRAVQLGVGVLSSGGNRRMNPNASRLLLELALELHWQAYQECTIASRGKSEAMVLTLCRDWLCENPSTSGGPADSMHVLSSGSLNALIKEPCGWVVLYACLDHM